MSKLSKWTKKAEQAVSNAIPHQHSADRRAANEAVAEQISYYQQEKKELADAKAETDRDRATEKKRVREKQIKSLRRNYRAPGFMDEPATGLSDTLG